MIFYIVFRYIEVVERLDSTMDYKDILINSVSDQTQREFIKLSVLLDHSSGVIHQNLVKALGNKAYSKKNSRRLGDKVQERRGRRK